MGSIKDPEHPYTKYRPEWCGYTPFWSIDYCWGLADAVDKKQIKKFLKGCKNCDFNKERFNAEPKQTKRKQV